jgi:hypothetical protein
MTEGKASIKIIAEIEPCSKSKIKKLFMVNIGYHRVKLILTVDGIEIVL